MDYATKAPELQRAAPEVPPDFVCIECKYPCGQLRSMVCPECGVQITEEAIAHHHERAHSAKAISEASQIVGIFGAAAIGMVAVTALLAGGRNLAMILVAILCILMPMPIMCGYFVRLSMPRAWRDAYAVMCLKPLAWVMSPVLAISIAGIIVWVLGRSPAIGELIVLPAMAGVFGVLVVPWVGFGLALRRMEVRFGLSTTLCLPVAAAVFVWSIIAGGMILGSIVATP